MTDIDEIKQMNQYLTFTLDDEIFALDIAEVREVLEIRDITVIPRMPDFMRGVINLRGNAVPVIDMRMKMNMPEVETTVDTCIIITEIKSGDDSILIGSLVDSVREVYEMQPEDIKPSPVMGNTVKTDFISGMGNQDGEFIIILDFDRILSDREFDMALHTAYNPMETATKQAA